VKLLKERRERKKLETERTKERNDKEERKTIFSEMKKWEYGKNLYTKRKFQKSPYSGVLDLNQINEIKDYREVLEEGLLTRFLNYIPNEWDETTDSEYMTKFLYTLIKILSCVWDWPDEIKQINGYSFLFRCFMTYPNPLHKMLLAVILGYSHKGEKKFLSPKFLTVLIVLREMLQDKYDNFDIPIDFKDLLNSSMCVFYNHCIIHHFIHLDLLPLLISIANKNDDFKLNVSYFFGIISKGLKNDEINNKVINNLILNIHSFTLPIFTHLKSLFISGKEVYLCSTLCDVLANLLKNNVNAFVCMVDNNLISFLLELLEILIPINPLDCFYIECEIIECFNHIVLHGKENKNVNILFSGKLKDDVINSIMKIISVHLTEIREEREWKFMYLVSSITTLLMNISILGVINSSAGEKNSYYMVFNKENGKIILLKFYKVLSNIKDKCNIGFEYENSKRKILICLLNMEKGLICNNELIELMNEIHNFIDGETPKIKMCREDGEKYGSDLFLEIAKKAQEKYSEEKKLLRKALEGLLDAEKYILNK
jgi:hypothetical protein